MKKQKRGQMNNFKSFEEAKKEPQTKQYKNKYYMTDTKEIVIFKINKDKEEQLVYKSPLTKETYSNSKEIWNNLTKEKEEQKEKRTFNSRDEFLRASMPFTDDELYEMNKVELDCWEDGYFPF